MTLHTLLKKKDIMKGSAAKSCARNDQTVAKFLLNSITLHPSVPILLLFEERFPQLFTSMYYIYVVYIVKKPAETQSSLSG